MKYIKILPLIIFAFLPLVSCDDDKMEWYKDPSHGEVSMSEIPLLLAEKISRYEALNSYTTMVLGIGGGLDLYMDDDGYRKIIEENFDEMTVGYLMKHGPMVNQKGELNTTRVDAFMEKITAAGLTVFGHTLVWHQNQNAAYLNSLIAPTVIPAPAGDNQLENGGFEDGMDGWGSWGGSMASAGVTSDEYVEGSQSLKVVINSSGSAVYSAQVQSPSVPLVIGHHYQISFYIRSDKPGAVRISFDNGLPEPPLGSFWPGNNASDGPDNTISTSGTWKQVIYDQDNSNAGFQAAASAVQIRFDLGLLPDVTYYIDNIVVVDLDAAPVVVNLVSNGTFDAGLDGWSKFNGPDNCLSQATGTDAYQGGGAMKVSHDINDAANQWRVQVHSGFTDAFVAEKKYKVSYMIRSDASGSVRCSTSGTARYQGDQATGPAWKEIVWELTGNGGETGLNFDLGAVAGTYYIDNVVVQQVSGIIGGSVRPLAGPIIIEKTPGEKKDIITASMEDWISKMVGRYKNNVKAWDVVNEPMDDGKAAELKTGVGKEQASDEFYWQDYMGKDYAVTAFNLARRYGNPGDKLFINDYNLEYNLAKCDGLIGYVRYIESQGASVDGIGTQMHVDINTSRENIALMFQKLAATGKLVKVSELDIKVNTATPTAEQLASQSDMYQYIIDMYMKYIPESQRYGITIWGVSDSPGEHENWIPNDAPNLWDKDYKRKHAYKGAADGLAGRDVSADFTGELVY